MSESLPSVLVIGAGSIGERHINCFQATGRAQVSTCEVNQALRERIADQYRIDSRYETLDSALSASHDAVVVATPAPLHVQITQQTSAAGLHALIEKPLSTSLARHDALRSSPQSHAVESWPRR